MRNNKEYIAKKKVYTSFHTASRCNEQTVR